MPKSFLIKKTESPTQEHFHHGSTSNSECEAEIDEAEIFSEQAMKNLVIHNNNFLPYLAAAASAMRAFPNSINMKKDLYNEFFVLDDPKAWKIYQDQNVNGGSQQKSKQISVQPDIKVDMDSSNKVPSSQTGELSPKSDNSD
eukprot:gene1333-1477_t